MIGAQYYDKMTEMDQIMGEHLDALERAGLKDSTIVVYWGDHGIGLPRGKRTALDSGLRVPSDRTYSGEVPPSGA